MKEIFFKELAFIYRLFYSKSLIKNFTNIFLYSQRIQKRFDSATSACSRTQQKMSSDLKALEDEIDSRSSLNKLNGVGGKFIGN